MIPLEKTLTMNIFECRYGFIRVSKVLFNDYKAMKVLLESLTVRAVEEKEHELLLYGYCNLFDSNKINEGEVLKSIPEYRFIFENIYNHSNKTNKVVLKKVIKEGVNNE